MDMLFALGCVLMFSSVQIVHSGPLDQIVEAYWTARAAGNFDEAVKTRELARAVLESMAANHPNFEESVQDVARLYDDGGRAVQARKIVESALERAAGLGDTHPTRVMLLEKLADMWDEDRNQLRAAEYRKQVEKLRPGSGQDIKDLAGQTEAVAELELAIGNGQGPEISADVPEDYAAESETIREQPPAAYLIVGHDHFRRQREGDVLIFGLLYQAQTAANEHKLDEAFGLVTKALDNAPRATDRDQLAGMLFPITTALAAGNMPERADQLLQRAFALAEGWSAATLLPLLELEQIHATFLIEQKRWYDLPRAFERYRDTLVKARGASTGRMSILLGLCIHAARAQNDLAAALAASQELMQLEESLSGTTSEPYLVALERRIEVLEDKGEADAALDLRRQSVGIADAAIAHDDDRRAVVRMQMALALARMARFDEAARMAAEAVDVAKEANPKESNPFRGDLREILRLMGLS